MKILFLSKIVPNEFRQEFSKVSEQLMDNASIGLQERIMIGLMENDVVLKSINVLPVYSYSKCRILQIPGFKFTYFLPNGETITGQNVEFNNLPYLKQLSQTYHTKKAIQKALQTDSCVFLLVYSPFPPFLKTIISAKKVYPELKVCIVYPDLPSYMSLKKNTSISSKLYTLYNKIISKKAEKYCDKAIYLTSLMSEVISIRDYAVMEGIATKIEHNHNIELSSQNYIIYAGTLNERFGVLHLLRAFRLIINPELKIYICGIGDAEDAIKEMAHNDNRIVFLGKMSQRLVFEYLSNAKAIINPRLPGEEFTKYSFPSKNLEALSSGIPFIAYKLPGIPDEYDKYINYPIDLSEKALAEIIEDVCVKNTSKYITKAIEARSFVYNYKNPKKMTMKIINLLNDENINNCSERGL